MTRLNYKRIALGSMAATIVWSIWTSTVTMNLLMPVYRAEMAAGRILSAPRYGLGMFFSSWFLMLMTVSALSAWLYAALRPQLGSGIGPAAKLGTVLGFIAALPVNVSVASWAAMSDTIPLTWAADTWVGAILATCIAALIYKDAPEAGTPSV